VVKPMPGLPPGRTEQRRKKKTDPFYQSARWVALRLKIMRRYQWTCQNCGAKCMGKKRNGVTPVVDHKQNRQDFPELQWDESNLELLCHPCHSKKTSWVDNNSKKPVGVDGFPLE